MHFLITTCLQEVVAMLPVQEVQYGFAMHLLTVPVDLTVKSGGRKSYDVEEAIAARNYWRGSG
jgi:hypothetical protein